MSSGARVDVVAAHFQFHPRHQSLRMLKVFVQLNSVLEKKVRKHSDVSLEHSHFRKPYSMNPNIQVLFRLGAKMAHVFLDGVDVSSRLYIQKN